MSVEVAILPAREQSLAAINALIARSKGHWSWPAGYLEQALVLLTIDVDYLRTHQSFEVLDARSDLVGFAAIAVLDATVVLDHLWVAPERIGRGIGRRACEYVIQFARQHQWSELSVLPDPPSEGFYLRMGFEDSGRRVPSRVPGGPLFSVYRLRLRVGTILLALVSSALLLGCVTQPKRVVHTLHYERAQWLQLPGWDADNLQEAWNAFLSSCRALRFRAEWAAPCDAALAVTDQSPVALRNYFEQYFEPYKILKVPSSVRQDTGLITGYYEPLVIGARTPSAKFTTPLYAPPTDLLIVDLASVYPELKGKRVRGRLDGNHVVPYYTRAELPTDPAVQGKEIAWITSALDAFLLEIQGSGRVQLPSGEVIRLQYADQNGQPYRSIGRYLVENGELTVDQATMPGIRAWLAANPQRIQEVLNANPSVVFFNEIPLGDPNVGPRGAQGIPLTPGRSIAVDPAIVPLGSPVFLATTLPASDAPLQRLVIAQDTGGAINGAPRADFFWGTGSDAAEKAAKMRQTGSMWLLWPRNASLPTS